jgi:hypothetical protein
MVTGGGLDTFATGRIWMILRCLTPQRVSKRGPTIFETPKSIRNSVHKSLK